MLLDKTLFLCVNHFGNKCFKDEPFVSFSISVIFLFASSQFRLFPPVFFSLKNYILYCSKIPSQNSQCFLHDDRSRQEVQFDSYFVADFCNGMWRRKLHNSPWRRSATRRIGARNVMPSIQIYSNAYVRYRLLGGIDKSQAFEFLRYTWRNHPWIHEQTLLKPFGSCMLPARFAKLAPRWWPQLSLHFPQTGL